MHHKVTLRDKNIIINVAMGHTILESALSQEVKFPHGCKSGNCGACKSVLHSGDLEMSPYSEYALTGEEKNRGLILACRSVPWSDCEISLVDEDEAIVHAKKLLECQVTQLIQATHDIKIVKLKIMSDEPYDFSAGQYASLTFGKFPSRDYSMANAPNTDELEFHIRFLAGGAVTPHIQNDLKVGDTVKLQGPYGTAYFRNSHKGPIIAIAGGSGLAPIKSILEKALITDTQRPIVFYFGVRSERDLYLEKKFIKLAQSHTNFNFVPVLSEPIQKSKYRTGLLSDAVMEDLHDLDGSKAYIAGPPVMVESVVNEIKKLGMRREDCHADAFYTEADKKNMETS